MTSLKLWKLEIPEFSLSNMHAAESLKQQLTYRAADTEWAPCQESENKF